MKSSPRHKYILLAGASLFAVGAYSPALGQEAGEAAQAPDAEASTARRLGQITVTATQREESLQDVPIAVTALDPEALERSGVRDIGGLEQLAPSFNLNTSDTQSGGVTLRLRGVGTTGNNIGLESSVGVFVDGVYLSRPGIALADLLDIQQIEVLRGPQGTLFGRNTSAGALVVRTKKPNLSEVEGFTNATVGNYELRSLQAGVSIPVVEDMLGVRLSGAVREREGFVEGLNGSESGALDRLVLRGQALADLGGGGEMRLILDYNEAEDQCCDAVWHNDTTRAAAFAAPAGFFGPGFPSGTLGPTGGAPNIPGPELEDYDSNGENFFEKVESFGLSAEYNVETPLGDLTYIGSYRDFETQSFRNTDYVGADLFTVGVSPEAEALGGGNFFPGGTDIETITHELRLAGLAFDDRLDWLVGAYYSDEEIVSAGSLTLLGDLQESTALSILGGSAGNVFANLAAGVSTEGDFAENTFTQQGESMSIFTHNVLEVTDRIDLTVGLRYVDESKDGKFEQTGGQFNACNAFYSTVAAGFAPNTNLSDVIRLDELSAVVNCFVFAAPAIDADNLQEPFATVAAGPQAYLLNSLPQEFDDTFEDDELVYTVKGSYAVNDTTNVYASFTHGFKSGGFNLDASAAAGGADPRFDSEKIDAYEVGLKSDFLDGRARANVAVFFQEMEDFQVLEFTGTRFQTFNVGKAESSGVEFEGAVQLTDALGTSLGVTYADAKYPDDCTPFDPNDPDFARNPLTLCGSDLTNAPEWVAILGATYEKPILNGGVNFFATGSVRYETERRTSTQPVEAVTELQIDNPDGLDGLGVGLVGPADTVEEVLALVAAQPELPGDIQDANTKVNLRIGFEAPDKAWAIEFWGQNIFDERTKNVTFNIPLRGGYGDRARGQFVQDPATYGVTLRTRF